MNSAISKSMKEIPAFPMCATTLFRIVRKQKELTCALPGDWEKRVCHKYPRSTITL